MRSSGLQDRNERGFTLLEVIVAVAILGMSLVTLLGLQIKTIRLQQISNRTTVATLLAQEKITEKMIEIGESESPPFYSESGEFEDETFEQYGWEYTVTATEAVTLFRIDLTVFWDEKDKTAQGVTLSSFVSTGTGS